MQGHIFYWKFNFKLVADQSHTSYVKLQSNPLFKQDRHKNLIHHKELWKYWTCTCIYIYSNKRKARVRIWESLIIIVVYIARKSNNFWKLFYNYSTCLCELNTYSKYSIIVGILNNPCQFAEENKQTYLRMNKSPLILWYCLQNKIYETRFMKQTLIMKRRENFNYLFVAAITCTCIYSCAILSLYVLLISRFEHGFERKRKTSRPTCK